LAEFNQIIWNKKMFSQKLTTWGEKLFGPTSEGESSRKVSYFVYSDTGFFMAHGNKQGAGAKSNIDFSQKKTPIAPTESRV